MWRRAKSHLVDCNYSVFACCRKPSKESSLFSVWEFEKTHLHVLLRSTLVHLSGHVHAQPSVFSTTFPFPLWAAAINFCVFRITFPSGEEWSVKSNLRNARPPIHNFSGCNYANDRSFSDLYPSACMDGGLPLRQPAFCFRALYHFVTAREPDLKCWGAHLLKDSMTFCAALSPSLSIYFCCICLCQCNILIISFSVSLLPYLFSLLLFISCSLSLFLAL